MGKIPGELRATIARNIHACRMNAYPGRGGSKKCAETFGVSPQQWSQWERGLRVPDELRIKQIADFFGKTVEYMRRDNQLFEEKLLDATPCPGEVPVSLPQSSPALETGTRQGIVGLDYPPPASWKSPPPGSPESFFWLARHFVSLLETKEIQIDKRCLAHLTKLIKETAV